MRIAKVIGTGSYAPDHNMTNEELTTLVDTSDEWIYSRTGIKERRISHHETTSQMAYQAARMAIEKAGIGPKDLDLIICATITADTIMPSVASVVQKELGASGAVAFDIVAACTGLVYGIVTADAYIRSGIYDRVLVVGAESLSNVMDWSDRGTCILFGDGAGAVVLEARENQQGIIASHLSTDGAKGEYLTLAGRLKDNIPVGYLQMNGQEVFKFASRAIVEEINQVLLASGYSKEQIAYVIPHQANYRIIEYAVKTCNIPLEKFYMNLDRYGNTSAASIGIALDEMVDKNLLKSGDLIILVGFGGGLTSGAILLEW